LVTLIVEGEDWVVGFDEVFETMPNGSRIDFENSVDIPSSRVAAHNESRFEIELELGGFAKVTPRIQVAEGFLVISADKTELANTVNQNYLQRGISAQGFRRSYQLGKALRLVDSTLSDGSLRMEIEQIASAIPKPLVNLNRAG
jgi:HSP20 family molecular chaperone IbpA